MATYTIEPPAESADATRDEFAAAAKPAFAGIDSSVGDIVEAARSVSTDAVARVRAAYDQNPARTFLVAVVSLTALIAVISLARHG